MKTKKLLSVVAPISGLALTLACQAPAQTFMPLHSFSFGEGGNPQAGLLLMGDTLYGTAMVGGSSSNGTVFALKTDQTGFLALHHFTANNQFSTNSDGANPWAGLVQSGNTFYGTAIGGGASGNGTVFAVNTDGTAFTNLHSFTAHDNSTNSDGANPYGGVLLSGTALYGTARHGGSSGNGVVFALNTDGTGFTNLHSFGGIDGGANPVGGLVLANHILYGTCAAGGDLGNGIVFKVNTDGTGFTNLHTFSGGSDGAIPLGRLLLSGDTLYGTARNGGTFGKGTVFAIRTDGTGFANLHDFAALSDSTNNHGASPHAGLILVGNRLYGTARFGGTSGNGTVFAISTNGTSFTNLYSFTGADGANPFAELIVSGNTLYGTASQGGAAGNGAVFRLSFPPELSITASGTDILLSWPTSSAGFSYAEYRLQSVVNVGAAGWSTNELPSQPVIVNGRYVVTVPNIITNTQQFYRLGL